MISPFPRQVERKTKIVDPGIRRSLPATVVLLRICHTVVTAT
jgi:hypothetical protein